MARIMPSQKGALFLARALPDRYGIVPGATVRLSVDLRAIHLLPADEPPA